MTMLRQRLSIASVLSLTLVLVVTTVLAGFGVFGYRTLRTQQWEKLHNAEAIVADQLAVALTIPAWNFDHDQIDRIIEGAMQNREVAAIVFRLAGQQPRVHARVRDAAWKVRKGDENYDGRNQSLTSRQITIGGNILGTVDIFVTPRFVEASLARTGNLMITSVLVLDVILVLSVYLLLWKLVFKPVQEIELYAKTVSSGQGESAKPADRGFFGELESLRLSLKTMIDLLQARFTALQESDEQLRSNESRLRALSDNLPDGMVYQVRRELDGAMRFEYLSAGLQRLNGLRPADVLRDASLLYSQIVEEDRLIVAAAEAESLRTMTVFNVVVRLRRGEGDVRWMHFASTPRRVADGRVVWDGIELDVTVQRETEAAVRASEAQYRELFNQMISGLMVFEVLRDGQGRPCDYKLVKANPASEKLTGLKVAERLGKTGTEISMGWPPWLLEKFYHVALSGEPIQYERYNETLGRFFETRVFSPSAGHFAHVFNDISERKRIETALIDSAERLRLALQVSGLGVWRRDLLNGVTEWDARMNTIFGRKPEQGNPTDVEWLESVVPEERAAIKQAWQDFMAGQSSFDFNFRIRRSDGQERHINRHAMIQKDANGHPISIIGVDAEMTDLVRMTEESVRLRDKLRQAQKMETLGTLAAGIAHDFNNLLTGINGFVELGALTLPADHEAVGMLKQARHGAMSARDLVRRILDFSRKVPDAERAVVKLPAFIRDIAPFITSGLPSQATLSFDIRDDVPAVRADTGQIQQVLMNLCVNGAHAIGERGGFIRISLSERTVVAESPVVQSGPAHPGRYVCLAVADTGCGMSAEVCARIFEPFYTTKKTGEGTGLGLSVVQDIVVDHGGFIRVRSEQGKGTTFEIFLPACVTEEVVAGPVALGARLRGRGERVLILDDEPFVTSVAQRALIHAGYTPEVFNSSTEAWAHFEGTVDRYDLLLIDHQMPELTGGEFAGRVRQLGVQIPIICMSARVGDLDPDEMHRLGGIETLQKPFEIEVLLEKVAAVFRAVVID